MHLCINVIRYYSPQKNQDYSTAMKEIVLNIKKEHMEITVKMKVVLILKIYFNELISLL